MGGEEVTQRVMAVHGDRRVGRIVLRADERSLTPYAGLAVSGELARRGGLAGLIDAELAVERRARPVKVRRGLSAGELVVSLGECQLVGGAFFDHVEDVRADGAGAGLRAVADTPSAAAAGLQSAKRFRRVHVQRVERAVARAGERLDRALGRDPAGPVTVDLDATQVTVYGRHKRGAGRSRHGSMSFAPRVALWTQRGRALTGELVGGNRERLRGGECARIARRATGLLPAGHRPVKMRVDSAYCAVEALRAERARFTVSVPRTKAMWKAVGEITEDASTDALDMPARRSPRRPTRPSPGAASRCG